MQHWRKAQSAEGTEEAVYNEGFLCGTGIGDLGVGELHAYPGMK